MIRQSSPRFFGRFVRSLRRDWLASALAVYLLLMILLAIFAPLVAPYDPTQQDLVNAMQGPSPAHLLGTDDLGRDVLSRMLYGSRVSFQASLQAVGVALVIAVPIGLLAGYHGGRIDSFIMRALDVQLSLPGLILVIALATALGGGLTNTMLALSIAFVPSIARVTRAETLSIRQEAYIEASKSIGTPTRRILLWRVLRNVAPVLQVQAAITLGLAIGLEAALSFIGLGVDPPNASWGSLLRSSFDFIFTHPLGVLWPALAIVLTAWAFNALGDVLGDTLGGRHHKSWGVRVLTEVHKNTAGDAGGPAHADDALLSVRGLSVGVHGDKGDGSDVVPLVRDISFTLNRGRVVGIVGESGSGKTVTALSLLRLFNSPPGVITAGSVLFRGEDITEMSARRVRQLRGRDISMIFQNPKASLNPTIRIGDQIVEVLRLHGDPSNADARKRARVLLEQVGIDATRSDSYPHQLSGGMCQRVMVAMAIACQPPLIIADEPTSALDVTVQAEVLDLLHGLKESGTSILLITHDLGVVADICDDVLVMYAGEVVEYGSVEDVLLSPAHPYTRALLSAMPSATPKGERLASIEGQVPAAGVETTGCRFADRCAFVTEACVREPVQMHIVPGRGAARCIRIGELPAFPGHVVPAEQARSMSSAQQDRKLT